MSMILDIATWSFIAIGIGAVLFAILLTLSKKYRAKNMSTGSNESINQLAQRFMSLDASEELGELYIVLIKRGFFTSLRTNNHSKDFDDYEHLKDFKKFANSDIVAALKEVGETYERYHV